MLPFILTFSISLLISLLLAGCLYFLDRHTTFSETTRASVHPSIFEFFTTLYAVFLGFALFTLWSAYINTERNIAREADALFNAYRSSMLLSDSQDFRQALRNYVKLVVADEWYRMANGGMSAEADERFDRVLEQLHRPKSEKDSDLSIFLHVRALMEEVSSLRQSRGLSLSGNLYRPIWIIIIFGFFTILFGFYSLHVHQTIALFMFNFLVLFLLLSCIFVIYDIDQPFSGAISVSPAAFQKVLAKMQAVP
jgi:Protein of unknown function (DUF4239)